MSTIVFPNPSDHARGQPPRRRSPWAIVRDVVLALYLRELKTRVGQRWWGLVWLVGEPLLSTGLMLAMYAAIRTQQLGGVDRLVFLVTGFLPFQLFRSLVLRVMEAVEANQALFAYRQVRPLDAIAARVAIELTLALALALATAVLLTLLGHEAWPARPLEWFAASALLVLFGAALGLLAAAATSGAFAKARLAIRLVFVPAMLLSGVMMPMAALPPAMHDLLLMNPLLHLLELLRLAFFGERYKTLQGVTAAVPLAWTLGALALGLLVYRVRRERLAAL